MADETCQCGHPASEHEQGTGCLSGWAYDDSGIALEPDGCLCQWAHVTSPVRRGGIRG